MRVQGYFRILNFFDVAEAVEMERLRPLLGPAAVSHPPSFVHRTPEYAQAQNVPILELVDPVTLATGETLAARIKYYWFGVVSVELATPFECDFDSLCPEPYRWMNAPEVENAAEDLLRARLERLKQALIKPSPKWLDEDYLVVDVQSARYSDGRPVPATEMLQSYADQIAQVVRGEVEPLSAGERDEVIRAALSYSPSDLIVVGW